jgi:hypothetical protein
MARLMLLILGHFLATSLISDGERVPSLSHKLVKEISSCCSLEQGLIAWKKCISRIGQAVRLRIQRDCGSPSGK